MDEPYRIDDIGVVRLTSPHGFESLECLLVFQRPVIEVEACSDLNRRAVRSERQGLVDCGLGLRKLVFTIEVPCIPGACMRQSGVGFRECGIQVDRTLKHLYGIERVFLRETPRKVSLPTQVEIIRLLVVRWLGCKGLTNRFQQRQVQL